MSQITQPDRSATSSAPANSDSVGGVAFDPPVGSGDFAISARDDDIDGRSDEPWYRATWPLHRWEWLGLLRSLLVVIGVGAALGILAFRLLPTHPIVRLDERVANWFVARRTDGRTTLAEWGALMASTPVKVMFSIIAVALTAWWWRRWHEAVWIALTLSFEATAFIVISFIVHRPRPAVDRLLDSPLDTSFPSGHVAAATAYLAFAVIVFWHTRSTWMRAAAILLCSAVIVAVATARMYQGMHFLSDVIGGVILGLVSIIVCGRILGPPPAAVSTPITRMSSSGGDRRRPMA